MSWPQKLFNKDHCLILPLWGLLYFVLLIQLIPQTESILQAVLFPLFVLASFYPLITYLSGPLLQKAMRSKSIRIFIVQFICLFYWGKFGLRRT